MVIHILVFGCAQKCLNIEVHSLTASYLINKVILKTNLFLEPNV